MAAHEWQTLQGSLAQPVPETPQATQTADTVAAANTVAYENAGEAPQTPKAGLMGLWPHVQGGFSTWLVIIVMLFLAFYLFKHAHGSEVSITATVSETVSGEGGGE